MAVPDRNQAGEMAEKEKLAGVAVMLTTAHIAVEVETEAYMAVEAAEALKTTQALEGKVALTEAVVADTRAARKEPTAEREEVMEQQVQTELTTLLRE